MPGQLLAVAGGGEAGADGRAVVREGEGGGGVGALGGVGEGGGGGRPDGEGDAGVSGGVGDLALEAGVLLVVQAVGGGVLGGPQERAGMKGGEGGVNEWQ